MLKSNSIDLTKLAFKILAFGLSLVSMVFLLLELYVYVAFSFGLLAFLFFLTDIKKYIVYTFIVAMFIATYLYWPLRIQTINIVSYFLFFYFLVNFDSGVFNSLRLPNSIKITLSLLCFSVFLSLINSTHFSGTAVYLTYLFFTFILTFYVIFRFIFTVDQISKYIEFFIFGVAISGIIIIFQILLTSYIRSVGLAGFAIMDFSAMALTTVLIMFFLLGKPTLLIKVVTFIILLILITTLSRFAWLGFTLSFIYGIIISMKYGFRRFDLLKDRLLILFSLSLLGLGVVFATGLHNLFIERFSDVDFTELLTQSEEKDLIENSLETRIIIWIVAFNAFFYNMWTGLGYQMFFVVSENYNFLPEILYESIVKDRDAHTTFLNFLVDNGIIGLISYLAFTINVFWLSFKSIKLAGNFNELKISIVLNTLVFFILVHSIYSGAFTFGQNAFNMYFIFALVVANYVILKKNRMKTID